MGETYGVDKGDVEMMTGGDFLVFGWCDEGGRPGAFFQGGRPDLERGLMRGEQILFVTSLAK